MRTSEAAAWAGVNAQTLRYYERRGLLAEPPRRGSGYRAYSVQAVRTVRFIKRAQHLGFTLNEIEELLDLSAGGPSSCATARELAHRKITDMQRQIEDLTAMRDALARLADTCEQPPRRRECPLLDSIAADAISPPARRSSGPRNDERV